jgi:hypothetical protein
MPGVSLITVGKPETRGYDILQWHNVHTKFREKRSTGSDAGVGHAHSMAIS